MIQDPSDLKRFTAGFQVQRDVAFVVVSFKPTSKFHDLFGHLNDNATWILLSREDVPAARRK